MRIDPKGAGTLRGNGSRKGRPRYRDEDTHWTHLYPSDRSLILEKVPDFEEGKKYTLNQLNLIAEKILLEDPKPPTESPMWLNGPMYKERSRREIYTAVGTPDPSIVSGLYNRTHPQGRKFEADPRKRADAARSFYR